MSMHTTAVFEHGVLRPMQPLDLTEGEVVELLLTPKGSAVDSIINRFRDSATLEELFAAANAASDDGDYDLLEALDQNRALAGDERRLLSPAE